MGLFGDVKVGRIESFMDLFWLLKFSLNLDAEKLALFAMLAWCLWTSRNQVKVGGVLKSAVHSLQWAQSYLEEF